MIKAWLLLSLGLPSHVLGQDPKTPLAGAVVKSDEWIVRREPRKEEEFIGHVSYRKGPTQLAADHALFRHDSRLWTLEGSVRAEHRFPSGDRVELRGDRSQYSLSSQSGQLSAAGSRPIEMDHFSEGQIHKGLAGSAAWSRSALELRRDVSLEGPRLDAWAQAADLDLFTRVLTLSGARPVLYPRLGAWLGAIKADRITANRLLSSHEPTWTLSAEGQVTGWLQFQSP